MEKLIADKNSELKKKYLEEGPLVYELYGIMLHSGGAQAGHYSAYIKDFQVRDGEDADNENRWYHFNDSYVKKISITEIANAFGSSQDPKTRRYSANHANAYMLMYRLVQSEDERIKDIPLDEIFDEVLEEVQAKHTQVEAATVAENERKQKMTVKIIHVKQKEGNN